MSDGIANNYGEALHALSGARPVHDDPAGANGTIARNLADLLIARGLDPDTVEAVAFELRTEAQRRAAAARKIERLTAAEKPAGAGKIGLSIPDRIVPRFDTQEEDAG